MLDKLIFESKSSKSFGTSFYSDPLVLKKILHEYHNIRTLATGESRMDLIDICIDLVTAIEECGLTQSQSRRLSLWMLGYNEPDIASVDDVATTVVHTSIVAACRKISNQLTGTNNV